MGIDVEAEESNHKEIVKQNAKTVPKRGDGIFTAQLGHGIWWMQKLEFFRQAAGIGPTEIDELKQGMSPYDCQLRREQQPIQDDMCIVRRGWKCTNFMIVYSRQENSHHFKVDVHFNTKTKHDMLLPPFVISYFERHATSFHNQKQSSSQGNQANVSVFDSDSFVRKCCTEATFGMEKHEIGTVRSHPNYQGNGPWRDWVMAKIPDETDGPIFNAVNPTAYHTIPCQVMCFVCLDKQVVSQTETQQQSKGNTLVQHKQGLTHVLLRTTHPKLPPEQCEMSKLDKERSSTLFKRWRKQYVKNGNQRETAKIVLVPVNWIVCQVGVIDENPELINEGDAVGQFLQSETEQSLLREDAKKSKVQRYHMGSQRRQEMGG